jgi:hypothetical protein
MAGHRRPICQARGVGLGQVACAEDLIVAYLSARLRFASSKSEVSESGSASSSFAFAALVAVVASLRGVLSKGGTSPDFSQRVVAVGREP